jgi:hypothetical protein
LLDIGKVDLLDRLYQYNDAGKDDEILIYFKDKLSLSDYYALRDSLFLRSEFMDRRDVSILKQNIRERYGERGCNISNLCTAGYFESLFKPLFENFTKRQFEEIYELVVDKGVYTLFVNAFMTIGEIKIEITDKIELAKKYGIKQLHVHGIGVKNSKNIGKCIEQLSDESKLSIKRIYKDDEYKIIVAELLIK